MKASRSCVGDEFAVIIGPSQPSSIRIPTTYFTGPDAIRDGRPLYFWVDKEGRKVGIETDVLGERYISKRGWLKIAQGVDLEAYSAAVFQYLGSEIFEVTFVTGVEETPQHAWLHNYGDFVDDGSDTLPFSDTNEPAAEEIAFDVTVKPWMKRQMGVPSGFVEACGPQVHDVVTLVLPDGSSTKANLVKNKNGLVHIGKGWKDVYADLRLSDGDTCTFALADGSDLTLNCIRINVSPKDVANA